MAGRASVAAVRQPRVDRPHRRLDRERKEEPEEHQATRSLVELETRQLLDHEAIGAAGTVVVERDDSHQHDQPAEQGEQQELHRGILPAGTAEGADQEVDGDEHRLEEDVEQEHVGRGEDTNHECLEDQHQREVGLLASADLGDVMPRGEDADGHQDRSHHDQDERDAVHAHGVAHAELPDPGMLLLELELEVRAQLELQCRSDREQERDDGEPERDLLGPVGQARGQEGNDERTHQRDQADCGQPRKTGHHCTSHTAPRITTTPKSIVKAYERTKPFWTRRRRDEEPPIRAATVPTTPSTPLLSKNTRKRVRCRPGRISTPSLTASWKRSWRAALVGREPTGATTGTSSRQ